MAEETVKQSTEAGGGDPGASMVKRKLASQIVTPKARFPNVRTAALKKYVPRPLAYGKKAVSLDDLSRYFEDVPVRRRRAVGVSPVRKGPRVAGSPRISAPGEGRPSSPMAVGAPSPQRSSRLRSPSLRPSASSPALVATAATAAGLLLKRRVTHRRSLEGGLRATQNSAAPATTGTATSALLGPAPAEGPTSDRVGPVEVPNAVPQRRLSSRERSPSLHERPLSVHERPRSERSCPLIERPLEVDNKSTERLTILDDEKMDFEKCEDLVPYRGYCDSETDTEDLEEDDDERVARAAKTVFSVLLLNAWRRRRVAARELDAQLCAAGAHAGGLTLQVRVLRQLLDAERTRVSQTAEEVRLSVARADRLQLLLEAHVKDRTNLENQLTGLRENMTDLKTKFNNIQNDCITARNEVKTHEEQLANEREKLTQLRVEKQALLDKVHLLESKLTKKTTAMEDLERELENLKPIIARKTELERVAEDSAKALEEMENEATLLREEVARAQAQEEATERRLHVLEQQQTTYAARRAALEALVSEQQTELTHLRMMMYKASWRQRVIRVARALVRLPFNIMDILQPYPLGSPIVRRPTT